MKKLFSILFMTTFLFAACEGDQGPQGPPGPPGENGVDIVGISYEYDVEFQYVEDDNIYFSLLEFPTTEKPSDAILVYRLETIEGVETWNLIPKSYFFNEGILQISSNHTDQDVELLIEADFDLENLDASFTSNQYYRVVVVPSDFEQSTGVDTSDINAVMNALDLKESDVKKVGSLK
ncbi:hypothetical protein SAMN05660903_03377 [Salegentibacter salinarum]|nr:hypothetical protein [Salegentibacter salinarum]SKB94137.1 hypothetical protein SAMN05660903_03377 [Salegentibacter salinarum]